MTFDLPLLIDDYPIAQIEQALLAIDITPKARAMIQAHARARNRAMSRMELARTVGGTNVNVCNSVYGNFAKRLALAIDPTLALRWKPPQGGRGDYVMFLSHGPARRTSRPADEPDEWVFVMREAFARALANVGVAEYSPFVDGLDDDGRSDRLAVESDVSNLLSDIDQAAAELDELTETEKVSLVLARIGQGPFRQDLFQHWDGKCAVTGVWIAAALVASHIKPWRMASNSERVDKFNGFLLVGTLDRLFDAGLISFADSGVMLIHDALDSNSRDVLGLTSAMRLRAIQHGHLGFLRVHRELFAFPD